MMKIGELSAATGLTVDTLRYYERLQLLDPPTREVNGYRSYNEKHLERVKFVQTAKALGFSLAQITAILPRLSAGTFGRAQIERELHAKLAEVDEQIERLHHLKRNLVATFSMLTCELESSVSTAEATIEGAGKPIRIHRLQPKSKI